MAATKLYPPGLEGTLPAFYGTTLVVPFSMNKAESTSNVHGVRVKIKTVQSNTYIITKDTKDFFLTPYGEATFDLTEEVAKKKLNIGQYYKIQIAFLNKNSEISAPKVGYFSTVGVIKYTSEPKVSIYWDEDEQSNKIKTHKYQYMGQYLQTLDASEKVYSYHFNLYDSELNLLQTSGEQIHNSQNDTDLYESHDLYNIEQDLELNQSYFIEYVVTTINDLQISSGRYKIMQKKSIDPEIKAKLIPVLNYDNGYVSLSLEGEKNSEGIEYTATGSYKILRASEEDNYMTWNEILRFALYGQKPSKWVWNDFTVKQGVSYKYALQQYNDKISSNRLESEPLYVDFEDAFLYDGSCQLKIKYNPKVTSFKHDILESKTDTIGSKYPFIFRNGNVKYKEFPISGLISLQSDEENLFNLGLYQAPDLTQRKCLVAKEGEVITKIDTNKLNLNNPINLVANNIANEREFKLAVLDWLNNGEPKLFRSPTEGNYIVRILNVSLTPNDTLGRMLHTFSATAYEIAEYNYNNLGVYGFISTEDPTRQQIRWETIELNKTGIGEAGVNLLNYRAIALKFEGMVPGDRVYINDGIMRNGKLGLDLVIGATGSYEIDLAANVEISAVWLYESYDNINSGLGVVQHQGTLTYAYYSKEKSRFSSIEGFNIQDVPLRQFIGEHDILTELGDIKTEIQGLYFLHASLREIKKIYSLDNKYYEDRNQLKEVTVFDAYPLYQIIDLKDNSIQYYDYENNSYFSEEEYKSAIEFNGEDLIDLTEISEFTIKNPKNIKKIQSHNGTIVELAYQQQTITYSVEEDNNKYPEITKLKSQLETLKNGWTVAIKSPSYSEEEIKQLETKYKEKYKEYIEAVTQALEEEEAAQGDKTNAESAGE